MNRSSQPNLQKRYAQLADQLSYMGPVLPGSITERRIIGQASKKQIDRKKYGPYYQWTRKVNGKTITVNLSEAQVDLFQKAVDNNRKFEQKADQNIGDRKWDGRHSSLIKDRFGHGRFLPDPNLPLLEV